jgi:DNA-binding HxlR family transcriptional regulator
MEKDGLVTRTELSAKIPHVEYALTNSLGFSVLRLVQSVVLWDTEK